MVRRLTTQKKCEPLERNVRVSHYTTMLSIHFSNIQNVTHNQSNITVQVMLQYRQFTISTRSPGKIEGKPKCETVLLCISKYWNWVTSLKKVLIFIIKEQRAFLPVDEIAIAFRGGFHNGRFHGDVIGRLEGDVFHKTDCNLIF